MYKYIYIFLCVFAAYADNIQKYCLDLRFDASKILYLFFKFLLILFWYCYFGNDTKTVFYLTAQEDQVFVCM